MAKVYVSSYTNAGRTQEMLDVNKLQDVLTNLEIDGSKVSVTLKGVKTKDYSQTLKSGQVIVISKGSTKSGN